MQQCTKSTSLAAQQLRSTTPGQSLTVWLTLLEVSEASWLTCWDGTRSSTACCLTSQHRFSGHKRCVTTACNVLHRVKPCYACCCSY
jgi:hypothetical protein